jgi:hypothetical protein
MVEPLADTVRAQRAEAQAKLVALRRAQPPVDAERLRRAEAQANRCAGTPKSDTVPSIGDASGASLRAFMPRIRYSIIDHRWAAG